MCLREFEPFFEVFPKERWLLSFPGPARPRGRARPPQPARPRPRDPGRSPGARDGHERRAGGRHGAKGVHFSF